MPCMLLYVYGVVPFSICRNGCYGASTQDAAERARDTLRIDFSSGNGSSNNPIQNAFDTVSLPGPSMHRGMNLNYRSVDECYAKFNLDSARQGNLSIGEASVGGLTTVSYSELHADRNDGDRASTTAMAGEFWLLSVQH